jgi:DNA mismatch repair ATPase MutS
MQVVGVAATFSGVWVEVAALIAELDVLAGFADLATADPTRPYCKPKIVDRDEGDIVIKVGVFVRVGAGAAIVYAFVWTGMKAAL